MAQCVEYFPDASNAQQYGWKGFFRHHWWKLGVGLLLALFEGLVTGGVFDWINAFTQYRNMVVGFPLLPTILVLTIIVVVGIVTFSFARYTSRGRMLSVQKEFHQLTHYLRDEVVKAEVWMASGTKHTQGDHPLRPVCCQLCNHVRNIFRIITGDDTIECAIRIPDKKTDDQSSTEVYYGTAGRSDGFNPARDDKSQAIPANKGVARFFLNDKNKRGVLIYHDLVEAEKQGTYFMTENDRIYDDVVTQMVAPINGWSGKDDTRMIGLLHITSRSDPFSIRHVDCLRAVVDTLGATLPLIVICYARTMKEGR